MFAPKYRRKIFYEEHKLEVREILRKLCEWKGVEIIEGEVCPDHIHILVSLPPKMSVSGFMGYLKGKSATIIFQRWGNMKFAYRNREFWCKGYCVDTEGKIQKRYKNTLQISWKAIKKQINWAYSIRATRWRVASKQCMAGRPKKDALVRCL